MASAAEAVILSADEAEAFTSAAVDATAVTPGGGGDSDSGGVRGSSGGGGRWSELTAAAAPGDGGVGSIGSDCELRRRFSSDFSASYFTEEHLWGMAGITFPPTV